MSITPWAKLPLPDSIKAWLKAHCIFDAVGALQSLRTLKQTLPQAPIKGVELETIDEALILLSDLCALNHITVATVLFDAPPMGVILSSDRSESSTNSECTQQSISQEGPNDE